MEDKYLNGRGLKEYTVKVKEKMAFIENPTSSGLPMSLVNLFYPVGSYYETSNTSFNPNTAWGGTWVKDSAGRVTVSQDTAQTEFDVIGETGGEKTHTLTIAEMPKHSHSLPYRTSYAGTASGWGTDPGTVENWYATTADQGKTGGDGAHNNLQPYIVVARWHRTA